MLGARLGPYLIEAELGSGGMGTVYRANVAEEVILRDGPLESGTVVAVKVLHPHLTSKRGLFTRFVREAGIGQRIRHPNVVHTYDWNAFVLEGRRVHYLVMEYVEGRTLDEFLGETGLPEDLCRHIALSVARGLAAIHAAGAVHRDVKPENVFLTDDRVVKVMDLGLSGLREDALRSAHTGAFLGSFRYTAPEQLGHAHDVDPRADLYALGVVLYELTAARHPYEYENVQDLVQRLLTAAPRRIEVVKPDISPFFAAMIYTLIEKDPEDRVASARRVVEILEDGEDGAWWQDRRTSSV